MGGTNVGRGGGGVARWGKGGRVLWLAVRASHIISHIGLTSAAEM